MHTTNSLHTEATPNSMESSGWDSATVWRERVQQSREQVREAARRPVSVKVENEPGPGWDPLSTWKVHVKRG
jgi:hypothetical protein